MDTAAILAKEAATQASSSTCSVFVKTIPQVQRLQAAATQAKAKGLASALMAGVGFHNAAMEPEDRDLVESLFKSNDLPVRLLALLCLVPSPCTNLHILANSHHLEQLYTESYVTE